MKSISYWDRPSTMALMPILSNTSSKKADPEAQIYKSHWL